MKYLLPFIFFVSCATSSKTPQIASSKVSPTISTVSTSNVKYNGFLDFEWDDKNGKLLLNVKTLESDFLYVNSLAAGIGSNDIGLDRGQLGQERVVKFIKSGPKILLIQKNLDYRAVSDNIEERTSVEQAFAQSVIGGFKVLKKLDEGYQIDITSFILRDAHDVVGRLQRSNQGTYKLDANRSAVYLPRCKSFPDNTEFEATLTFAGTPKGGFIRSVTPTPSAVTVRQHHSFVRLPDDNYKPRKFDPRSGYFGMSFMDYASPINEDIRTRYITRHRLEKKDPTAAISEPVEPIIYYVDRGAPEPIKSALINGASWWNQAFEAAGYKDAFLVKEMPADADPLDVRYNLIQWVHRSTRGWSYGSSVIDPRTGEIIKGHVSLGSLRVRQDYLIAQGLFSPFKNGNEDDSQLMQLALARLRQLSAHEVGHTIGLAHNFASSYNDRASVMDYPHPMVELVNDKLNIDRVYDDKIGEWDKRTIMYGYSDFTEGADEEKELARILSTNDELGLKFISDRDSRPQGGSHPYAHLWDNGPDPVAELYRMSEVRQKALNNFGLGSIKEGDPLGTLENVLVPLYLSHRYQAEAVSKLLGGLHYSYAIKGSSEGSIKVVENQMQKTALNALLETLTPAYLSIPESITGMIPPMPSGYSRGRENFKIMTGNTFDPLAAAQSAMHHTFNLVLNGNRLARINEYHSRGLQEMSVSDLFNIIELAVRNLNYTGMNLELAMLREKVYFHHLMKIAANKNVVEQVKAIALQHLKQSISELASRSGNQYTLAHKLYLNRQIDLFLKNPNDFKFPAELEMPDGSPIGCSVEW